MSSSALVYENRRTHWLGRVLDYVELTKPKIAVLLLVTVAISAMVANLGPPPAMLLLHTLLGTAMIAASASALNQWLERDLDASMKRTANRPLPQGRLTSREVITFGAATFIGGAMYLAWLVNPLTAILGVMVWVLYVWVYTPLKRRTAANTAVGAIAGALPVWMGWTCVGKPIDQIAMSLFVVVFLWQFPHFMAIAWIYRKQYKTAGMKMMTVVDPSGRHAGSQAVMAAAALIPISVMPAIFWFEPICFQATLALGLGQLACAVWFMFSRNDRSARWLLRASLLYLPTMLLLLMLAPVI